MVWPDRTVKADVIERLHDLIHIERAVRGQMRRLLKIVRRDKFQVAHMGKMDAPLKRPDHVRQIILKIRPVGAGTKRHTVVRVVNHSHHPQNIFLIRDNPRQAENAPRRIIRMNRHIDVVSVADRHDFFQKIFEILKQLFTVHIPVKLE